jgi:zinc D-Ala-D-Ala carboxypeptidase
VTSSTPDRAAPRRTPGLLVAALVVIAAIIGALGYQSVAPSSSTATSPTGAGPIALGAADGAVPDGTTVFDAGIPGVAKLHPALLRALRAAATDAAHDGIELSVDSGWRSARYQEQLLRDAIAKYGSEAEASRWVASPDTSAHASGDAVDIGHPDATAWLARHGAEYGLCQIYDNEPWHYELRTDAMRHGCPRRFVDAAHDPRMQP